MAINFARGLDELGEGLLRQADIGGRAYEGAMVKEAETRAANRALAAEERANREWARREGVTSATAETVAQDLLAGREGMQAGLITAEQGRLDKEIQARKDAADALHGRQTAAALLLATSKGEADKIQRLMDRAKTEAKTFETLATEYAKSDDEAHRDRLETELMLSSDRMEAAYKQAGVPSLEIEENLNELKYRLIVPQIIFNVNSNTPRDDLITVYKSFRDNKPESSAYKASLKTLERYVQEAIDKGMVPEYRSKERTKTELTKRVVNYMARNYAKELDGGNGVVKDEDRTEENLSSSLIFGDPLKRIATDITKQDIGAVKRLGTRPAPTGRPTSTDFRQNPSYEWNRKLQEARNRDPEYLLPLLKKEKAKLDAVNANYEGGAYWIQDRLGRINELIKKFEVMLGDEQAALPLPDLDQGQDQLASLGMLNQRPGMIFEADRVSMAAPDVNARYAT